MQAYTEFSRLYDYIFSKGMQLNIADDFLNRVKTMLVHAFMHVVVECVESIF